MQPPGILLFFFLSLVYQGRAVTGDANPKNQTVYQPLYQKPSNSTPKFVNITNENVNPLFRVASGLGLMSGIAAADGEGQCAPGTPCSNGACCSNTGFCGFSDDHCSDDVCISNCNATAPCGQYALEGQKVCPLNVCCSQYGFCGTTAGFCGSGCDDEGGSCGPPPSPTGKSPALFRNIGYYESWAATRPCDRYLPNDLDLTGLTHLNFAFAFFHPTSFEVTAMDDNAASLLRDFTALKSKNYRLNTWISIGGWSFNNLGNRPSTRTAFSDMASTAENRAKFINSLLSFMKNYGFDGADIDWEYPVADDRGGKREDKQNFVALVKELKAAFAMKYGLSVTLPASYWYLQHFDVKAMEPYVDWFNVMTYDMHGVWDSSNEFTGPYVRPHTNLTEIDQGLSLLWRSGISSSSVVLGLAFYGRSFTLSDPSCSKPGCIFTEGGNPGECTDAPGILSAAEIDRILKGYPVYPNYDREAAIKWVTWDSDQWVSYDDEETFLQKIEYAEKTGLSGTMVWAIDQGVFGQTNNQVLGSSFFQKKTLYTEDDIVQAQNYLDAGESCYVSFCGEDCQTGYFSAAQMKGEVGELGAGSACVDGELQNLCCQSGTFMGRCSWYGWRGQGLSCYGGSCPRGDTFVTLNTNPYFESPINNYVEDEACNGGTQSYCCRGFKPPMQQGRDPNLIGPEEAHTGGRHDLAKRDFTSCAKTGVLAAGTVAMVSLATGNPFASIASLVAGPIVTTYCLISESEASVKKLSGYTGRLTRGQKTLAQSLPPGAITKPKKPPPKAKPKQGSGAQKMYGRYPKADFGDKTVCSVTYTCDYGLGFDQVCDNQRYGLDKITNPRRVFHYDEYGTRTGRMKDTWKGQTHEHWKRSFRPTAGNRNRCEIDEFPLSSLMESQVQARQALRALDGGENGRQGLDWQHWLWATWYPCSTLMQSAPPITWSIGTPTNSDDPRRTASSDAVIAKYGFDSVSGLDQCWATFTTPESGATSVVSDHGYRVHTGDPLHVDYQWPLQNYKPDPVDLAASVRPTSVSSSALMRRDRIGGQSAEGASETAVTVPHTHAAEHTGKAASGGSRGRSHLANKGH